MTGRIELEHGQAALARCDWAAARDAFVAALDEGRTGEALHGLGQALYWLADHQPALATLSEAYAAYRQAGQLRSAGRVASQLAMLHGLIDGNRSAVNGWTRHAERSLEGDRDSPEAGWLALLRASFTADPDDREAHARTAIDIGRRSGDPAVEFDGVAYLGKALVERGRLDDGLPLVDEAVAALSGGLVGDPWAEAEILCTLFHTCELAVDVQRAEDWLRAVDEHLARTGERPTYGICRMHYGGLLVAAGRWDDAERELLDALSVYDAGYRGSRFEAVLRLADLRSRQGRIEEAEQLLAGYEDLAAAAATRARVLLARDEPEVAHETLQRYLERRGRGWLSAPHLALLVEAQLSCGDTEQAREIAEELVRLAEATDQALLSGLAALSHARVAAATSDEDAAPRYERALTVFADSDLPWELAQTHLELAQLLTNSRPEVARSEARAALDCLERVGRTGMADAAAELLRELGDRSRSWPRAPGDLTAREQEVLELVKAGLTNLDIARRLHISVRTAEHHVSSILAKLGVNNRAEAAAYAVRTGPSR